RELGRDLPHAVCDLLHLVHDLAGRGLVGDDVDLVAVLQLPVVGRTRGQHDHRLAEERSALLAEGRVVVERDVVLDLPVPARRAAHSRSPIESRLPTGIPAIAPRDRGARPVASWMSACTVYPAPPLTAGLTNR